MMAMTKKDEDDGNSEYNIIIIDWQTAVVHRADVGR